MKKKTKEPEFDDRKIPVLTKVKMKHWSEDLKRHDGWTERTYFCNYSTDGIAKKGLKMQSFPYFEIHCSKCDKRLMQKIESIKFCPYCGDNKTKKRSPKK